jgi:hypothetical protein
MEVIEPVNPKAYQIADEYQLGTVQDEYRDNTHLGWLSVMLLLFLGEIKVNQEQLIIKERDASGDWLSLPISLFPNLCVLEELLKHIQHKQGRDTQLL